ncbi:MAG: hypothetical protein GQ475_02240 [Methylococcaceae bacterium]|nr:hypothetical protein [Methylococcaceae bacterium]
MTDLNFTKVTQPTAILIAKEFELTDDAQAFLTEDITPAQFVQQLLENALYIDVIQFLAAGLSKRESTWWACLCARSVLTDESSEFDIKAIELAEAWVYKPTPKNCQLTLSAAEATEFKTAAGWSAMAAFWSGDNISPNSDAVVPPPVGLTAKAVNGAVLLAAVQTDPAKVKEYQQLFIKQGIDIASGGDGRNVN